MKLYAYDGAWQIDHLLIVGVGGTGSSLAHITARILWQRGQMGQSVPLLHLVDPDVVEEKNVGRQHFLPLDIGLSKAEVTARRLSLLYGLPILWSNETFDAAKHLQRGTVLVGCVDNHSARQTLVNAAEGVTYLDVGNDRTYGQVVCGSTASVDRVMSSITQMESDQQYTRRDHYYPCQHLPNIALLYPELLQPEPPTVQPDLSCAELVMAEEQHLLINDAMAMVCSSYLYKLINRQPLTTFLSLVDLHQQATTSKRICPTELRDSLGSVVSLLTA
ncbi:MAG: ThiF family adenylyltransferase [Anaerolineae bacterium]|nr:ThiF family adenylyltransferase [Anaerolineae bacterium]